MAREEVDVMKTIFYLSICFVAVTAEIRFVCPRPQRPNSALTDAPCGKNAFSGSFEKDFMEVRPGPLTLRIEDTIFRPGSPCRISLGQWGNDPHCVLLDHIPYREKTSTAHECSTHGYPLGECSHLSRYITVHIPDIRCDKCYLQLMSVVTATGDVCVEDIKTRKVNCTTYYSCANIRILPSEQGSTKTLHECHEYHSNLHGQWPYIRTAHSRAVIDAPFLGETEVKISLNENYLTYKIRMKGNQLKVHTAHDYMSIVMKPRNNTVFVVFLEKFKLSGKFKAFDNLVTVLRNENLAVMFALTQSHEVFHLFDLKSDGLSFSPGIYRSHSQTYSDGGWLNGPDFVGTKATYPAVLKPAGKCAPHTLAYGTLLIDNDRVLRAMVNHEILDGKIYVSGIFSNQIWFPQPILYKTIGDSNVKVFSLSHDIFNRPILPIAVLPMKEEYTKKLVKVTVKVSVSAIATLLTGKVRKSVKINHVIENEYFGMHAMLIPTDGTTWKVTVMIIRKGVFNREIRASVHLGLLTHKVKVEREAGEAYGRWAGTANIKMTNSSVPMSLWMGYMSLDTIIYYDGLTFLMPSVHFEALRTWHCEDLTSSGCWKITLWPASSISQNAEVVATHGVATFFISPSSNTLMYSVTVLDVSDISEKISRIVLSDANDRTILPLPYGKPTNHEHKSISVDGTSVLSWPDLNTVIIGDGYLTVHTTHSIIRAMISPQNKVSRVTLRHQDVNTTQGTNISYTTSEPVSAATCYKSSYLVFTVLYLLTLAI